jgi:hypothetical protein
MMTPSNPFAAIHMSGDSTRRGVTLEVPKNRVRAFLPAGLELGDQNLTQTPGTHPVFLFFNDMFRLHLSVPTLIPSITYHELHVGIPFTYLSTGPVMPGAPGPYYFMPRLYLDNLLALFGGIVFFGLAKNMAGVSVTANSYTVASLTGHPVASLEWIMDTKNPFFKPTTDFPLFEPVRQALSQSIISRVPASVGPYFAISDFTMAWDSAAVRPLHTAVVGDPDYLPGYPGGRVPLSGWSTANIETSPLGSYELRSSWRLSLPYPPPRSFFQSKIRFGAIVV